MLSQNPEISQWRIAMLKIEKQNLRALVKNYIQPALEESSPEQLVSQLGEYLQKPETQQAIISLLDDVDQALAGLLLLKGNLTRHDSIFILRSEISEYELDYRLDNLVERLIIYRTGEDHYNLTPFLKAPLCARWKIQDLLFGSHEADSSHEENQIKARFSLQDLFFAAAFFCKFESSLFKKNGQLTAHAINKLQQLFKTDDKASEIIEAIISEFEGLSILTRKEHAGIFQEEAFMRLMLDSAAHTPAALALQSYPDISSVISPFLDHGFGFSSKGLMRFFKIIALSRSVKFEPSDIIEQLVRFNLLQKNNEEYYCVVQRMRTRKTTSRSASKPQLLIDGTGVLHLLPEAGLDVFLAVLKIAELRSASEIWSFEITRESAKKAFAEGYMASGILDELRLLSQGAVPEMLAMTLVSWEREHVSLRIMKGYIVSFDDEMAGILEAGKAFETLRGTRLAKNLVFLDSHQAKMLPEILGKIGLPVPPVMTASAADHGKPLLPSLDAMDPAHHGLVPNYAGSSEFAIIEFGSQRKQEVFPPSQNSISIQKLLDALSAMNISDRIRSILEERIKRRLIISIQQLQLLKADLERDERQGRVMSGGHSAEGLNFQGKLHIIKGALKNKKSRLTVQWMSDGRQFKAEIRPVSLEKTDKDYLLSGENLESHEPLVLRVGMICHLALSEGIIS